MISDYLEWLKVASPEQQHSLSHTNTAEMLSQKEEALNLVDQGLLGGQNKEIANEGDWHANYSKLYAG